MEDNALPLFADGIAPIQRDGPAEVFYLRIKAIPQPGSDDFGRMGGAFFNCYVDADDLRTAELRALAMIRESGWQPQKFETWKLVGVTGQDGAGAARELIEQARTDGAACALYCWPIDAPDADDPDA